MSARKCNVRTTEAFWSHIICTHITRTNTGSRIWLLFVYINSIKCYIDFFSDSIISNNCVNQEACPICADFPACSQSLERLQNYCKYSFSMLMCEMNDKLCCKIKKEIYQHNSYKPKYLDDKLTNKQKWQTFDVDIMKGCQMPKGPTSSLTIIVE